MKRKALLNQWFFSDVPKWVKFFQIYIKGDSLVVLPLLIILVLLGFIDARLMIIVFAVFFSLRQMGEMIYWIHRQFYNTGYRPYDFGFKNLSNKAIYVIYQLLSLSGATIGISLLIYVSLFS